MALLKSTFFLNTVYLSYKPNIVEVVYRKGFVQILIE